MIFKILAVTLLVLIFISLASGLVFLVKDSGKSNRVVTSLTWRVGLSLVLFIILVLGLYLGGFH